MEENYNKLVIEQLILANMDKSNQEIAKIYNQKLNKSHNVDNLRRVIKRIRKKMGISNPHSKEQLSNSGLMNKNDSSFSKVSQSSSSNKYRREEYADSMIEEQTIEDFTVEPGIVTTIDQAKALSKVDMNVWEIDHHIFNTWTTSGIDRETGKFKQINNVQVKLWFKRKVEIFNESDAIEKILSKYKPIFPEVKKIHLNSDFRQSPSCLLISMTDFHLDKRTLDGKTIDDKIFLYQRVINNLITKSHASHFLDEIVFVASSDFMHTDNYQESTTKGTPQQSSVSWYDAYELGFDLLASTISLLKHYCNKLTVVHVPSNHSKTKEFYMLHALSVMFSNDKNIIFDRSADSTKVYVYGNNFLGFHHGDVKNYAQLPNYFSSKYKSQWGSCKYAEIALGDKHHRKEWVQSLKRDEVNGTRMFICPSLSGPDIWHKDSLYDLAIGASIARVYDKEKGFCTEFEERI